MIRSLCVTILLVLLPISVTIKAGSVERVPDADGNYTQLTPSTGTDHYALVDEASCSETDYNHTGVDDYRDSYTFPVSGGDAVPADSTVDSVVITICCEHAGPAFSRDSIRASVRIASTDYDGDRLPVMGSQATVTYTFTQNPATSSAWTITNANDAAIEFGVMCVEASDDTYIERFSVTWYYSAGAPAGHKKQIL